MRNMPSKFIELFDSSPSSPKRISTHDVRLEDVLAHQEASLTSLQSRSSTFSSSKLSLSLLDKDRERELSFSPSPTTTSTTTTQRSRSHTHTPSSSRWKRLSSMLGSRRASWLYSTEYPACIYTIWRVDVLCMHTHTHTPQYIQSTWYYAFTHIAIIAIICYYLLLRFRELVGVYRFILGLALGLLNFPFFLYCPHPLLLSVLFCVWIWDPWIENVFFNFWRFRERHVRWLRCLFLYFIFFILSLSLFDTLYIECHGVCTTVLYGG